MHKINIAVPMKNTKIALLLVFLAACGSAGQPQQATEGDSLKIPAIAASPTAPAEETLIVPCERFGPIKVGDSHETIVQRFGEDQVALDTLFLEGSPEGMQTVIWQDTPKEIVVIWADLNPPYQKMSAIDAHHPGSPYRYANGIRVGMPLAELEQINGKPFKFYGFGWDYGGTFVGFAEGQLAKELPCFGGYFAPLDENSAYTQPGNDAIMGDREIRSDNPVFKKIAVKLASLRMNLPVE